MCVREPMRRDAPVLLWPLLGLLAAAGLASAQVAAGGERAVTITVTAPNGGETWAAGTQHAITWTGSGGIFLGTPVAITLLRGGVPYAPIASLSFLSSGSFTWTVCEHLGDGADYQVRVACIGCDPPAQDDSDAPFTITNSPLPTFALTSPNGTEIWAAGDTRTITWDSINPHGYIAAWLCLGAQRWFIGEKPMADGQLVWDIDPFVPGGSGYTVRLQWLDTCGPVLEDYSDAPFQIVAAQPLPTLAITSPNGGEAWAADTTQTITWASTNPAGDVELWLTDGQSRYQYVGSAAMADGQLTWPVSPCVGDANNVVILARWAAQAASVEDTSDGVFQIAGSSTPAFTVTSPLPGEIWTAGTQRTITWTGNVANGEVDVELLKAGTHYVHLGHVPAAAGSFIWDICPAVGDDPNYTIRLRMGACGAEGVSGSFAVTGSVTPTLTLISPVGGETWIAGTPRTITWTSSGLAGFLDVYVPNAGVHDSGHAVVPVTAGSFEWPIPPPLVWPPPSATTDAGGVWLWSYDCGPSVYQRGAQFQIVPGSALPGDIDGDNDVDLADLAAFQAHYTGRGPLLIDPVYDFFDFEPDADVDIDDFGVMAGVLTGPGEEVQP